MLTSRPEDNSPSTPAGPITEQPVTKFPSINAVGAKRRVVWGAGACMQMHVGGIRPARKDGSELFYGAAFRHGFFQILQRSIFWRKALLRRVLWQRRIRRWANREQAAERR